MSNRPAIDIEKPSIGSDGVDFKATVAGYEIHVRMPAEFVADAIGNNATRDMVAAYFASNRERIEDAAWALAYAHSTRDPASADASPVPYLGSVSAPFAKLQVRR